MAKSIYSISSMKMGAAGAAGAMGATLVDFAEIAPGSVSVNFPEATQTPITPENADSPSVILEEAQAKTIEFESMDVDVAKLPEYFGGANASGTFTPGVNFKIAEQSFQFTTRPLNGVSQTWKFPRTQVSVSIAGSLVKNDILKLKFKVNVLQPYDALGDKLPDFSVVQA